MTHVFEGQPDGRQSDDTAMPTSRFRPRYRALADDEKALHDAIKSKAAELETLFEAAYRRACPPVVLEPLPAIADGEVHEAILGESIVCDVFKADPKQDYFADGLRSLELAVMWTVKGLTA